ncbi:hypothetical protein U1Q18_009513 [Sarracenia purpurea var. burkii]
MKGRERIGAPIATGNLPGLLQSDPCVRIVRPCVMRLPASLQWCSCGGWHSNEKLSRATQPSSEHPSQQSLRRPAKPDLMAWPISSELNRAQLSHPIAAIRETDQPNRTDNQNGGRSETSARMLKDEGTKDYSCGGRYVIRIDDSFKHDCVDRISSAGAISPQSDFLRTPRNRDA